jgi:HEAT repeat protein
LVEALGDSDQMVRFQAMVALRDHLNPALLPIIEPLLKDPDNDIRRYAVEYYAELSPPDTADRLVEALGDSDQMVRFQAMVALRDHLNPALLPIIEPLLKDPDNDIRRYAVEYYAELQS